MNTIRTLFAIYLILLLSACASGPPVAATGMPDSTDTGLAGSAWQLIEIQSMDDAQGNIRPPSDRLYTVRFHADGSAAFQLDCNRGNARWSATAGTGASSGALGFDTLALTRAMCPPPSLDIRIARDLPFVRSFIMRDGLLSMSLMADGAIYRWTPFKDARAQ